MMFKKEFAKQNIVTLLSGERSLWVNTTLT